MNSNGASHISRKDYNSKFTIRMQPSEQVEINRLQLRTSQQAKNNIDIPSPWNLSDFNPFQQLILPKNPKVQNLVIDIDKLYKEETQ